MKKFLLSLAAVMAGTSVYAGVDPATYPVMEGIEFHNLNMTGRNLDLNEFNATEFAALNNKIRSAIIYNDKIIYGYSKTITEGESSADHCFLLIHDLYTGKFEKLVEVTVNGAAITGTLPINQIGLDDYGHVWFCGCVFDSNTKDFTLYRVLDVNTGEAVVEAVITVPDDDKSGDARRHDYYDLVGDITGVENHAVFITPVASDPGGCSIIGMAREQGSDEWTPHFNGGDYASIIIDDTYPAGQTTWNGAPMVRIVRDEECSGELFYIDAFVTAPALYNTEGTLLDSFAEVPEGVEVPKSNCNGCIEFKLGGEDYFIYTKADYDIDPGSCVQFCKFGEDMAFSGLTPLWSVPAGGFGTISDSGTRSFGMPTVLKTDSNGKEGVYIALSKCNNGFGTYLACQPGFNRNEFEQAGVQDVMVDDVNAPVEYFNLQGVRVSEPAAGQLVIRRQGGNATKVLVK